MKLHTSSLKAIAYTSLLAITLSGCAAAVVGGAAVGAGVIADRRSNGAISDDNVMEVRIYKDAMTELKARYARAGITKPEPELSVTSYNRKVLLLGQVVSEEDKALVETIARKEQNVTAIYNHIQVTNAERGVGAISQDTWITTKLRSRMVQVPGVYAGHFKVVTYNNIVYAMGILTPSQQTSVTEAIRVTPSVQQVVTLYEDYQPQ